MYQHILKHRGEGEREALKVNRNLKILQEEVPQAATVKSWQHCAEVSV